MLISKNSDRKYRPAIFILVGAWKFNMSKRRLTYWRASWLGGEIPGYRDLEAVSRAVLEAFPSVSASRVVRGDGSIIEIRHRRIEEGQPVLLHCATHVPGAEGSVVPKPRAQSKAAPLKTIPPPEDADFLSGALVALIKGNHCLICCENLTIGALRTYIQQLVSKRSLPSQAQRLEFLAVANREKIDEIVRTGVAEVGLSASLDEFEPSTSGASGTIAERASARIREAFATLFEQEIDIDDLMGKDFSNINAKLTISFDKRRHGFIDQETFDTAAQHVIEEQEPGIYIRLRSGSRIDHQSIKLSKQVALNTVGSTIDHAEAWVKLEEFYAELVALGHIPAIAR